MTAVPRTPYYEASRGVLRPLEEVAPMASMSFECIDLAHPKPSAKNLLTMLECYFAVPACPSGKKPDTYVFGEIAEVTFGGKGSDPVTMFVVLYLSPIG